MKQKSSNKLLLLWYSYPRVAIALVLVLINLAIIGVFTGILTAISGNSFWEELSYIFTFTMSADGIYDFVNGQDDIACFVVKAILLLIQMVIFSGALIGFTTNILQTMIDERLSNAGKLSLKDHFVFLNWSSIGPNLIYDLSFLEGQKVIVVLCEEEPNEVLNSIQNIFIENGRKMKGIRLFIKQGDPTSPKHLADISVAEAKHIGILLSSEEESGAHSIPVNDLASFKLLMSLLHMGTDANIVVEVEQNKTAKKIEQFILTTNEEYKKRVSVFSHNAVIGHILGRAVINPAFSDIYHELLSYDGCEFYGIAPMDIETALYQYNDCIPIINYDDDGVVDDAGCTAADQLYVLSHNAQHLGKRREPRSFVRPLPYREQIARRAFTLIVISNSDAKQFILEEIKNYNAQYNANITCIACTFDDDVDEMIDIINGVDGEKRILMLSTERDDEANQDADIFITMLAFRTSGKLSTDIPIYTEIANPRNYTAMQNLGVASVIVTNKIISLFMIQLLTHPESERFYRDLIVSNSDSQEDVMDIEVVRADELLVFHEETLTFGCVSEFVQSFYLASKKSKMCIGVKRKNAPVGVLEFLCSDMDREVPFAVNAEDELIIMEYVVPETMK